MKKDEAAVDRALSRFSRRDPHMRRLARRVVRAQDALREVVTERAWRRYMRLEEAVNARDYEYVSAAIRVASKISAERLLLAVWQAVRRVEGRGRGRKPGGSEIGRD